MQIVYSPRFEKDYNKLPHPIKEKAVNKEVIFKLDPFDKRLKTHKLSGELFGLWSFSIDYKYRIIFEFTSKKIVVFHAIGSHSIYF